MPALVSYNLTMTIYACTEAIIAFANRAPNGVEDHRADASTQSLPFLAAGAFSFAGAQSTVSLRDAATLAPHPTQGRTAMSKGQTSNFRLTAAAHPKRRKSQCPAHRRQNRTTRRGPSPHASASRTIAISRYKRAAPCICAYRRRRAQ